MKSPSRRMHLRSNACFFGLLLVVSTALGQTTETPPIGQAPWEAETLSKEALEAKRGETAKELETIPADAKADAPEGQLRTALTRRTALLNELLAVVGSRDSVRGQGEGLPKKKAELDAKIKELESLSATETPAEPTAQGLAELKGRLDAQRKMLDNLKQEMSSQMKRVEEIPALRTQIGERGTTAEAAVSTYSTELAAAQEGPQKTLLAVRLGNAKLQGRVAKESLALLDDELDIEKEASTYRSQAIDYQQRFVERTEKEHSLYQKALETLLAKQQKAAEAALAEKKEEAKAAVTASEKFLASWEQKIAQSIASKAALETRTSVLSTLTVQQEMRLQAEKDRLTSLKELVGRVGTGGRGGERIKTTYQRIRELRRAPKKIFGPPVAEDLEVHRARRFELDELILTLEETWRQEFEGAAATLSTEARSAFEASATNLREDYRKALLEEHAVLGQVISDENKLQNLGVDLSGAIDDLEDLILPKLYWIRDSEPVGAKTLVKLRDEVSRFASWSTGLFKNEAQASLVAKLKSTPFIVLAIVLLVLLHPSLYFSRRLRRVVSRDATPERKARGTALAVVSSAVLPLYLFVAAVVLYATDLPESNGVVFSKVFLHIAIILFLWLLNRSFFRASGIAESKYGMRRETSNALFRSVNLVLLAYLVWLLPWAVLKDPPFRYDALPRAGYTLFSISALVPIFLLMRKSSPLIQDLQEPGKPSKLFENWTAISGVFVVVFVGTIVMDVLGLRFGAFKIATSTLFSLVTVVALVALYRILAPVSTRILKKRKRQFTTAPGETSREAAREREKQIRGFLRTFFVLLGLLLIAVYWGINERALNALDTLHIWEASAEPLVWVSVADVLKAILAIVLTLWVLRNLPGLYEVAVFPRIQLDPGIRYAVLTISRYGVSLLGALIALAAIELNLAQIGWLMAAIGFGLGFGMQEIISNFVSGLILLIERPVRVGDIAKVGDVLGTVTRINIRATTVTSFDRLENIIPNKDLITKAVTNWTLADRTTRLIIPIGVAYGSDIDEVRSLLLNLAVEQPEVLKDPAPLAFFIGHGDSSLNFELRFFVDDPGLRLPLQDRLNTLINKELTARKVEIPFPQRDIHVKMEEWPKDLARLLARKEPLGG